MTALQALYIDQPNLRIVRTDEWPQEEALARAGEYAPKSEFGRLLRDAAAVLDPEDAVRLIEYASKSIVVESSLSLKILRKDGTVEDLGCVGKKLVTTAGVNYLVAYLIGGTAALTTVYHGLGTGVTAAAIGDTLIQTEIATADYTSSVRATGTHVTGASSNIYQSVATNTIAAGGPLAITELGIMTGSAANSPNTAASATNTLFDHFVFASQSLNTGDGLQSTFNLTFAAGS